MKKINLLAIMALGLMVALAGCSPAADDVAPEPTPAPEPEPEPVAPVVPPGASVSMDGFEVTDGEVSVQAGATVTWTNDGDIAHIVQINNVDKMQVAKSGTLESGDSFDYTFDSAGEFNWISAAYPGLVRGTVSVE